MGEDDARRAYGLPGEGDFGMSLKTMTEDELARYVPLCGGCIAALAPKVRRALAFADRPSAYSDAYRAAVDALKVIGRVTA